MGNALAQIVRKPWAPEQRRAFKTNISAMNMQHNHNRVTNNYNIDLKS